MRRVVTCILVTAALTFGAGLLSVPAAAPALAEGGCIASASQPNPYTPRSASLFGRTIELRYSAVTRCAWGRISNGSAGDSVWLNRKNPDGSGYVDLTGVGGKAFIGTGSRSTYTPTAFNDNTKLMRACGKANDRPDIVCTGWF